MDTEERLPVPGVISPFERIRRTNAAGAEYGSGRYFARVPRYPDCRNFGQAMKRAKTACFRNRRRVEAHFTEIVADPPKIEASDLARTNLIVVGSEEAQ